MLIYNVNDKDKVVSAEQEDAQYLVSLFESYSFGQIAFEGLTPYVVKTENKKFLFDSEGNVVVGTGAIQGMFRLNQKDLEVVIGMFIKYGIFLEESVQAVQPANDHTVLMGELMISIAESKQDITTKLNAADLSYVEIAADDEHKGKYDSYYGIGASLQVYFLDDKCVRIR